MPHQLSKNQVDPEITAPPHGWPRTSANNSPVLPSVELELADRMVSLVRILACGDDVAFRTSAWSRTYDSVTDADDVFEALSSRQSDLLHWSVGAIAFGSAWLDTTIDPLVAEFMKSGCERNSNAGCCARCSSRSGR